jgi:ketosteroid isomerase-like protein
MTPTDEIAGRLAIHDLVARYADRCDRKDWAGVVALFAPEAVFDAQTVYGRTMTGPDELLDFFENAPNAVAHHPTSHWSTFDGSDRASVRMKMLVIFRSGVFSVDYAWQVGATDGTWRIARQEISLVGKVALPRAAS